MSAPLRSSLVIFAVVASCSSARPVTSSPPPPPPSSPVVVDAGAALVSDVPAVDVGPAFPALALLTVPQVPCAADEPLLPDAPLPPRAPRSSPEATAICTRLMAVAASRLRVHRVRPEHVATSLWCVPAESGAWATVLDAMSGSSEAGVHGFTGSVRLQWVPVHGAVVSAMGAATLRDMGPYWDEVRAEVVFDWNGEGAPEIVLRQVSNTTDDNHAETLSALTLRGGHIGPYEPAPMGATRAADFDGDGRVDLEVPSGITTETACGLDRGVHGGPSRFVRSTPDGRFAEEAAAVRAFVRRQCAQVDLAGPLVTSSDLESTTRVACALYLGVTPSDLMARVRAEYPTRDRRAPVEGHASEDRCFAVDQLTRAAASAVPFMLAPRCAQVTPR